MWCPANSSPSVPIAPVIHRLSLIAALDTEGRIYYSLTQVNTDQNVVLIFLIHLIEQLDLDHPSWRDDTVILMDGARYHTGGEVREYMRKLQL